MDVLCIVNIEKKKQMKTPIDKIKKIKSQYDFPIWLIKETLEYHNGDEDAAIKRLIEIYRAIGDHPDIVVKKTLKNLLKKYNIQKLKTSYKR